MTYLRHLFGKRAEHEACAYLKAKGLRLIEKNYACRMGEIDLIMQDQSALVFIEVRFRHHNRYGNALESINQAKVKKIVRTAMHYLQSHPWSQKTSGRFDVVAIDSIDKQHTINWIKGAFMADGL